LFVEEAPHGHQAPGAQLFGTNLGAAAAWRPELVEEAAAHTATELRARGVHVALVSGLDILRDPRWGRAEECFGEDPLLAALCVRALVRGMNGVAVVLKHFAGQGAAIGGRNGSGTPIGRRELAELHLPAARAGIAEGALGVMAAYNDIDGVPCCANAGLLTATLREEWGFGGIVMADMYAVDQLTRTTGSHAEAGALALRAGVDLSMCDRSYTELTEAVHTGLVAESFVDRACRRVLALKIGLGLLDPPRPAPAFPAPISRPSGASTVLLRNRLLPLDEVPARIAVIGPNADDLPSLLGDYVPPLPEGTGTTVLAGIRAFAGNVRHEPGSGLTESLPDGCARAAALAAESDLVVLVLGSSSVRAYGDDFDANGAGRLDGARPAATTGEGFDVAEVELPAAQRELAGVVTRVGTPVVAVVVSGRPHGMVDLADTCDAVLYAWYPGPAGGREIAEVVLGGVEPQGRLPVSLPRSSGTLPVAYNERVESTLRYVDTAAGAGFPFGAGLGWTTWELGTPSMSITSTAPRHLAGATVTTTVRNAGSRRGGQVVQLYGRLRVPGILPRRAVLTGFTRVAAGPGEERVVDLRIEPDALPALGLADDTEGVLDLWPSVAGPGEPAHPLTIHIV
jgi:beta-glucosidase